MGDSGSYEVKFFSVEDLETGRRVVLVELSGVLGEPAPIYQPSNP
ncbi:MAG: hypothetical protein ACI8UZ_001262 [Akkermansiaceae bacterium]|jgi:hypothetical protein